MVTDSKVKLIRPLAKDGENEVNLICFPCAGGSFTTYRNWPQVPGWCKKFGVELPGRGISRSQKPFTRMDDVVTALLQEINTFEPMPMVFMGHSLGAWIAYELCREMERAGLKLPVHLIISGSLPIVLKRNPPFVHDMSLLALRDELRELGGTPDAVLDSLELLAVFKESIQADFEIFETHQHRHLSPINMDVSVWAAQDDPRIPIEKSIIWKRFFSGEVNEHCFNGGHMFYDKPWNKDKTNALIVSELEKSRRNHSKNGDRNAHLKLAS